MFTVSAERCYGLFTHTETGTGSAAWAQGKSPGSIYDYSYMMQKVHTAEKQGQISVPKWLL